MVNGGSAGTSTSVGIQTANFDEEKEEEEQQQDEEEEEQGGDQERNFHTPRGARPTMRHTPSSHVDWIEALMQEERVQMEKYLAAEHAAWALQAETPVMVSQKTMPEKVMMSRDDNAEGTNRKPLLVLQDTLLGA